MDRAKEKSLMLRKVEDCVRNDMFLAHNVYDVEEFEFYSDTSKVMKELVEKYNLTLEELDELWNHYYDFKKFLENY